MIPFYIYSELLLLWLSHIYFLGLYVIWASFQSVSTELLIYRTLNSYAYLV
jgi:hypothetical protein